MSTIQKTDALELLNFSNIDNLNLALLEYASALHQTGANVPDEIKNPEAYDSIDRATLTGLRDFIQQLNILALPSAYTENVAQDTAEITKSDGDAIASQKPQALEFSPQVLQGARNTLIQLYSHLSAMSGVEAANAAWDAFDESFSIQNEVRFTSSLNSIESEIEETFNRLKQAKAEREALQIESLGKFQKLSVSAIEKAASFAKQAQSL